MAEVFLEGNMEKALGRQHSAISERFVSFDESGYATRRRSAGHLLGNRKPLPPLFR
jgi:hypothetical protein